MVVAHITGIEYTPDEKSPASARVVLDKSMLLSGLPYAISMTVPFKVVEGSKNALIKAASANDEWILDRFAGNNQYIYVVGVDQNTLKGSWHKIESIFVGQVRVKPTIPDIIIDRENNIYGGLMYPFGYNSEINKDILEFDVNLQDLKHMGRFKKNDGVTVEQNLNPIEPPYLPGLTNGGSNLLLIGGILLVAYLYLKKK